MPAVVSIKISTAPAEPAGAVAEISVGDITVKLVAGVDPKYTFVTLINTLPVIDTAVPPDDGPMFGETLITAGEENLFDD